MMPHDRLVPGPGANQLLYSRFNDPYWTCTSTLAGMVAVGVEDTRVKYEPYDYGYVPQGDQYLVRPGSTSGESHSIVNAAPAWIGPGTFRTTNAIQVGSWESVMFAIWVGFEQTDIHAHGVAEVGVCDGGGTYPQAIATFDVVGSRFVWGTIPVSKLDPALGGLVSPYVTYTPETNYCWWFTDDAQLEDATMPGIYYQTNGAAIVTTGDRWIRTVASTCPRCREKLFDLGKLRGKPRQETDRMIPHEKLEEG
jgi:hypothetical protein